MTSDAEKYWYNLKTGEVEKGYESPSIERAGPFDTAEEAARALDVIQERSRAWAEEEAREDAWGDDDGPVVVEEIVKPDSSDD